MEPREIVDLSLLSGALLAAPATDIDVGRAEAALGCALPTALVSVLRISNGLSSNHCLLYGTDDLAERNETLGAVEYAPEFLAIADDGGGRVALIHKAAQRAGVFVSEMGDMAPENFARVAANLDTWLEAGCPFDADRDTPRTSSLVDVYLVRMPPNGTAGLGAIRRAFTPGTSLADLRVRAGHPPVLLLRGVTRALFHERLRSLAAAGGALEARPAQELVVTRPSDD